MRYFLLALMFLTGCTDTVTSIFINGNNFQTGRASSQSETCHNWAPCQFVEVNNISMLFHANARVQCKADSPVSVSVFDQKRQWATGTDCYPNLTVNIDIVFDRSQPENLTRVEILGPVTKIEGLWLTVLID